MSVRGLHPRLLRYRLPDGWCKCAFRARVSHTGYGGTAFQAAEWEFGSPRALPPVIEIPSSRRGRFPGILFFFLKPFFLLKCQNWDFIVIFVA